MSTDKTHFRRVYKSDHLGVADLEDYKETGVELIFTIKEVKQEFGVSVAGRKGDYNIAYFVEKGVKPLVLNVTNANRVRSFCGGSPFVENWKNVRVELYPDFTVKMKGEVVGGVRIKTVQPPPAKIDFTEERFESAKKANATIEQIKKGYNLSANMEKKYLDYVAKK